MFTYDAMMERCRLDILPRADESRLIQIKIANYSKVRMFVCLKSLFHHFRLLRQIDTRTDGPTNKSCLRIKKIHNAILVFWREVAFPFHFQRKKMVHEDTCIQRSFINYLVVFLDKATLYAF